MAISTGGRWLAFGVSTGVKLFDLTHENPPMLLSTAERVHALSFRADDMLATIDHVGDVVVFDVASGERRLEMALGHSGRAIAFSPSGLYIAAGLRNGAAWLIDLAAGEAKPLIIDDADSAADVCFSPDSRLLAVAAARSIGIFDVSNAEPVGRVRSDVDQYTRVEFAAHGQDLVATGWHGSITIWDADTRELRHQLHPTVRWIVALAISPDGRTIAASVDLDTILLVSADSGEIFARLHGGVGQIHGLTFSPDGTSLIACGTGKLAREHSLIPQRGLEKHALNDYALVMDFAPDGRELAAACRLNKAVAVLDFEARTVNRALRGLAEYPNSVVYHPGGALVASCEDRIVRWRGDTRDAVTVQGDSAWTLTPSPDRKLAAMISGAGRFQILDAATLTLINERSVGERDLSGFAWSPDSSVLSVLTGNGDLLVYDLTANTEPLEISAHKNGALALIQVGPHRVATAGSSGVVSLWDTQTGKALASRNVSENEPVLALAISPDGEVLIAGDLEGAIHVLHPATLENICTVRPVSELIVCMCFHPTGNWLVASSTSLDLLIMDMRRIHTQHDAALNWLTAATGLTLDGFSEVGASDWQPPEQSGLDSIRQRSEALKAELDRHRLDGKLQIGQWWEAERAQASVAARARVVAERTFERAAVMFAQSRHAEAAELLAAISNDLPTGECLRMLGKCLAFEGDLDGALVHLRRAAAASGKWDFHAGEVWADIARYEFTAGNHDAAKQAVQRAKELDFVPDTEEAELWERIEDKQD